MRSVATRLDITTLQLQKHTTFHCLKKKSSRDKIFFVFSVAVFTLFNMGQYYIKMRQQLREAKPHLIQLIWQRGL